MPSLQRRQPQVQRRSRAKRSTGGGGVAEGHRLSSRGRPTRAAAAEKAQKATALAAAKALKAAAKAVKAKAKADKAAAAAAAADKATVAVVRQIAATERTLSVTTTAMGFLKDHVKDAMGRDLTEKWVYGKLCVHHLLPGARCLRMTDPKCLSCQLILKQKKLTDMHKRHAQLRAENIPQTTAANAASSSSGSM